MPSGIAQQIIANRFKQRQDAHETELNLLDAAVNKGATPDQLTQLSGTLQTVTPAEFNHYYALTEILRSNEKKQQKLSEIMNPQVLSSFGALGAQRPNASGVMSAPPPDQMSQRNEMVTNQVAALRGLGLPPDQQQQLQQQMMSQIGLAGMATQANAQNAVNQKKFETGQNIAQSQAIQRSGQAIQDETNTVKSVLSGIAWDEKNQDPTAAPVDASPEAIRARIAASGVAPGRVDYLTKQALAQLPAARAAQAKWERSANGQRIDAAQVDARMRLLQQDYPNAQIDASLRDNVTGEMLGIRMLDPALPDAAQPPFISTPSKEAQGAVYKERLNLAQLNNTGKEFASAYQNAAASGGGGPFTSGGIYDFGSKIGIQNPDVQVYQGAMFRYGSALLKAVQGGRFSDRDLALQLTTFPSVYEIGTPNGDAKLTALLNNMNDQIAAPYTKAARERLGMASSAPKLPSEMQAVLSEIKSNPDAPITTDQVSRFMKAADSFALSKPAQSAAKRIIGGQAPDDTGEPAGPAARY